MNLDIQINNGTLTIRDAKGGTVSYTRDQVVQRKINMVTLGEVSQLPKIEIARAFGYSTRKSYYDAKDAVLKGPIEIIIPKKSGPNNPRKRTKEIEILVIRYRFETDYNMYEIAEHLNNLGFDISSRVVSQILSDYGLAKKNCKERKV
jgi:hypothetical protein